MEFEVREDSTLFRKLTRSLLRDGLGVRFEAKGHSMFPSIADGDVVEVVPAQARLRTGDVVLAETEQGWLAHRVAGGDAGAVVTRGDCCFDNDSAVEVLGTVRVADGGGSRPVRRAGVMTLFRRWIARWRGHF